MTRDREQDHAAGADDALRARLCAADPASALSPVAGDRVQQLLEATMAHDARVDDPPPRSRREAGPGRAGRPAWRRWPVAAAAVLALVVGGVGGALALNGADDDAPALSATDRSSTRADSPEAGSETDGDPGPGASPEGEGLTALSLAAAAPPPNLRCRMVTVDALAGMETAFAGTVVSLDSDTVGFEVDRWYAGGDVDVVEVRDPLGLRAALEGPPDFQPGQRFLVTASEGQVSGCGFSAPYSGRLEQMFERAFS